MLIVAGAIVSNVNFAPPQKNPIQSAVLDGLKAKCMWNAMSIFG